MKRVEFFSAIIVLNLLWFNVGGAYAGQSNSSAAAARQQPVSKGYAFYSSHEEVVENAKQEGKLNLLINMEVATLNAATDGFMRKYRLLGRG